jgi:hypothetical protein
MKEENRRSCQCGNPNPVEDIEERIMNWLLARTELTQDGKLAHQKKGVVAV